MFIGSTLKKIRLEKGLSIRDVANETGLSTGFISNVERGVNSPTVSSLAKICSALDTSLVDLFQKNGNPMDKVIVRKHERETLLNSRQSKTVYEILTACPQKMKPVCITMEPGGDYGGSPIGHEGDEFGIVLEGVMEVTIGNETYIMHEGDSVYILPFVPHKFRNAGKTRCVTLWVAMGSTN